MIYGNHIQKVKKISAVSSAPIKSFIIILSELFSSYTHISSLEHFAIYFEFFNFFSLSFSVKVTCDITHNHSIKNQIKNYYTITLENLNIRSIFNNEILIAKKPDSMGLGISKVPSRAKHKILIHTQSCLETFIMSMNLTQPSRRLLVPNQQWKHQSNVWNLFKINDKDTRTNSITPFWCFYS